MTTVYGPTATTTATSAELLLWPASTTEPWRGDLAVGGLSLAEIADRFGTPAYPPGRGRGPRPRPYHASRLHAVAFTGDGEDGQVRIRAEITSDGADNTPVHSAVARISMEPAVTSAAWRQMPA